MGYKNWWKVLNAKDYGVPQNRERVFVVSILGGGSYQFPEPIKLEKRLKDVLEPVVDEKYYLSDRLVQGFLHRQKTNNNGFAKNGINIRNDKEYATALTARMAKCGMTDNYIGEPLACASRGRNPDNPNDRTTGSPTEQRLEVNQNGTTNTITTVQKDNYVIEPKVQQIGNIINTESFGGNPQTGRVYSAEGVSPTLNTMQGGGREPKIVDDTYANRPARVYENESPTIRAGREGLKVVDMYNPYNKSTIKDVAPTQTTCCGTTTSSSTVIIKYENYRIRKLTPRECWRLMGVRDEQFDKLHDISNSQLYKMAGNSIVVDVLMAIFKNMFMPTEQKGQLELI